MQTKIQQWLDQKPQKRLKQIIELHPVFDYVVIGKGEDVPDLTLSLQFHDEYEPMNYVGVGPKYHGKDVVHIGAVGTTVAKRVNPLVGEYLPMISDNPLFDKSDVVVIFILWQQRMGYLNSPPSRSEMKNLKPAFDLPQLGDFYATEWDEFEEAQLPQNRQTDAGKAYRWAADYVVWTPQGAGSSGRPFEQPAPFPPGIAPTDTPPWAVIRKILSDFYGDEELTTLCSDYFREVYNNFSTGMSKSQKIGMLIDHLRRNKTFHYLVAAMKRDRPTQVGILVRDVLVAKFNNAEFKVFLYSFGQDIEASSGSSKTVLFQEHVGRLDRQGQLITLATNLAPLL